MGVTVLGIQHHFYPRSPCGERHADRLQPEHDSLISIHALLAESDVAEDLKVTIQSIFLSTLSLRRATSAPQGPAGPGRYFYPRSPCGERH